jgi:hypothetical protein
MTGERIYDEPAIAARYEDAKTTAGALGYTLTITRRLQTLFALNEGEKTIFTFQTIDRLEECLRALSTTRHRRRQQPSRRLPAEPLDPAPATTDQLPAQ